MKIHRVGASEAFFLKEINFCVNAEQENSRKKKKDDALQVSSKRMISAQGIFPLLPLMPCPRVYYKKCAKIYIHTYMYIKCTKSYTRGRVMMRRDRENQVFMANSCLTKMKTDVNRYFFPVLFFKK